MLRPCVTVVVHMSQKSFFVESGLIMLGIPVGLLLIVALVVGLFLTAHDGPSAQHLPSANYHQSID